MFVPIILLVLIIVSWFARDILSLVLWCFIYVFIFSFIFISHYEPNPLAQYPTSQPTKSTTKA